MRKKIILFLMLSLGIFTSNANVTPTFKDNHFDISSYIENTQADLVVEIEGMRCEISGTLYIPTPYGIFKLTLSIEADTCEEASAGVKEAIKGFLEEMF